jgi:hypothetical protein
MHVLPPHTLPATQIVVKTKGLQEKQFARYENKGATN